MIGNDPARAVGLVCGRGQFARVRRPRPAHRRTVWRRRRVLRRGDDLRNVRRSREAVGFRGGAAPHSNAGRTLPRRVRPVALSPGQPGILGLREHRERVPQRTKRLRLRPGFVQGLHERLGGRFRLLTVGGARRSCAVLSIAPRDAAWREKLWVDARVLVWKSVFEEAGDVRRPARTRTTTWEQIEFPSSMDPAVFTFARPKGARRVKRFGSPPLAEPPPLQFPNP